MDSGHLYVDAFRVLEAFSLQYAMKGSKHIQNVAIEMFIVKKQWPQAGARNSLAHRSVRFFH